MALLAWADGSVSSDINGELEVTGAGAPCLSLFSSPAGGMEVDCLVPGTRLRVLDSEGNWLAVRLADGRLGWLETPCLVLHASPDEASRRLDCLPPGTSYKTLTSEGQWRAVRVADGRLGWLLGAGSVAPIDSGEPVPSPSAESSLGSTQVASRVPEAPTSPAPALESPAPSQTAAPQERRAPAAAGPLPSPPADSPTANASTPVPGLFRIDSGESSCLKVRETAGGGSMGCLPRGTVVEVIDSRGEWLAMRLPDGRTGWSMASFLSKVDAAAAADRLRAWTGVAADTSARLFTVAPREAPCLNIRAAASTESRLLACLPRGTLVQASEITGGWLAMRLPDDRTGWTIVRALTEVSSVPSSDLDRAAPTRVTRAEGQPVMTPTARAASPAPTSIAAAPQPPENSPIPAPRPAPESKSSRAGRFEVSRTLQGCLNVRPSPSTSKPPLTCLQPGTRVEVVDSYGKWSAIRFSDRVGWSFTEHLVRTPEDAPPGVTAEATESPRSESALRVPERRAARRRPSPTAGRVAQGERPESADEPQERRRKTAQEILEEGERRQVRLRPSGRSRQRQAPAGSSQPTPSFNQSSSSTTSAAVSSGFFSRGGVGQAGVVKMCLNTPNCTANDFELNLLTAVVVIPCAGPGSTAVLDLTYEVANNTGTDRYDVGVWVATDGGDVQGTGTCVHDYFPSPPFPNAEATPDACGDVATGGVETVTVPNVSVLCQDTDMDGFLDASASATWNVKTSGPDAVCSGLDDAVNNPAPKCTPSQNFSLGNVPVDPTTTTTTSTSTTSTSTTSTTTTVPTTSTTTTVPTTSTTTTVPTTSTTTTAPTTSTTTTAPTTSTTTTVPTTSTTTTVPTTSTTTTVPTTSTTTTAPTTSTTTTAPTTSTTTTVPTTSTTTTVPTTSTTTTVPTTSTTTTAPTTSTTTTAPTTSTTTTVPTTSTTTTAPTTSTTTVPTTSTTTTAPTTSTTTTVPTTSTTTTVPTTSTSTTVLSTSTTTSTSTTVPTTSTTTTAPTTSTTTTTVPTTSTTTTVPTTSSTTTSTTTTPTSSTTTTSTTLPPSAIRVTKTPNPTAIAAPGGTVTFTIRVNHLAGGTFTLTSLSDTVFGDLDGLGDCVVPQTIAPSGFYECSFIGSVSGAPSTTHVNVVTAAGTFPGAPPVSSSDTATAAVDILPATPTLAFWWQFALLLLVAGIGASLLSRRIVGDRARGGSPTL